jgi:uncharacterized protein YdaU (DUF1376 family)
MNTPQQPEEQPDKRKAPAFQFYVDDFLAGTLELSQADVGAYIRLLCFQWNRGSIPVETEKQQRLAGGSVSVDVLAKFRLQPDGRLVNERMERERQKQIAYREMQAKKGIASGKARRKEPETNSGSTTVEPTPEPNTQPETNSPSPSPSPSIDKEIQDGEQPKPEPLIARGNAWPTIDDVLRTCSMLNIPPDTGRAFWEHFEAQGWQTGQGLPIVQWSAKLATWWRNEQAKAAEAKAKAASKPKFVIGTSTPDDAGF